MGHEEDSHRGKFVSTKRKKKERRKTGENSYF